MALLTGDVLPDGAEKAGAAEARAGIARILASRTFEKAARLKRFLRFVAEESFAGTKAAIKESVIGVEVFDRDPATYDPRIDPIVRVEAGRLRAKLDDYYAGEGAADPVLVELPRGQYAPRFNLRAVPVPPAESPPAKVPAPRADTIAVLPFINISDDPANQYFSDGLTEELTHALARLPSVRVTARRSAFRFRAADRDIREIGRMLGAGKIVEGSVRRSGDRLRITVQLADVADGYQLWSERYDRQLSDALALQEEIAGAVRRALLGRLDAGSGTLPAAAALSMGAEAVNHYLLGRFHWNKRNAAGLRTGIAHFTQALALAPGYGRAWSGLADCNIMLAISGAERPALAMARARDAAQRAIAIDDGSVEAHTSLAVVRASFEWDRRAAEAAFQRALECDATYATLHHWYSLYTLTPAARFDEAGDEIEWAERLDPISLPINMGHAQVLHLAGNYPAAIAQCEKVLSLDPSYYRAHWFIGLAHDALGNFPAACEALETARRLGGDEPAFHVRILGALGHALARWGKRERAAVVLTELAAIGAAAWVDPFELAQVHAGLGDSEAALAHIDRAAEERSGYIAFAGVWPGFAMLRKEGRFRALLAQMSLPASNAK